MTELLLKNLDIKNFRTFQSLSVETFGRVNLIVGKNGVGKTSFLEALSLYANRGSINTIKSILNSHGEYLLNFNDDGSFEENNSFVDAVGNLFYNRPGVEEIIETPHVIKIGSSSRKEQMLSLSIKKYKARAAHGKSDGVNHAEENRSALIGLSTKIGRSEHIKPVEEISFIGNELSMLDNQIPNYYIPASGLDEEELGELWNRFASPEAEENALNALHMVSNQVEKVAVVSGSNSTVLTLKSSSKRVPLKALGDGMMRLYGIALGLAKSQNGILLIDEIENGLHYSIQANLWRLIITTAKKHNVQVFATTNNWETIETFHKASIENDATDGKVIRLQQLKDELVSVVINQRILATMTQVHMEMR
jgi:AAA15 family ATPase/GTPase